jgi:hypothetical protein
MAGEPTQTETTTDGRDIAPSAFASGAMVGRFVIESTLGSGGMGVVLAAHDPQTQRRVALKLVRGGTAERLVREGKAMAKLSHPNVLTLHEIATLGDDVFLVLELVEGRTVRAWLAERRRGWREVLEVFVPAGRGLAAAHAIGLVHRDVKPDNLLLGDDGRVRVMDFGLVRDEANAGLTRTGAIMGTPRYMPPEQHAGTEVDARADQWAFCASLFEALWGHPPTAGAVPSGGVPRRLRRAVMRGLAPEPSARHESMEALLAELTAVTGRRGAALAALAMVAVAGGVAGTAYVMTRSDAPATAPPPDAAQVMAAPHDPFPDPPDASPTAPPVDVAPKSDDVAPEPVDTAAKAGAKRRERDAGVTRAAPPDAAPSSTPGGEPRTFDDLMALGRSLFRDGQYDDALDAFERARALRPRDEKAHWNVAYAACKLGKTDLAREHLDALADVGADDPLAPKIANLRRTCLGE